ncbi:MAG: S41 family peptidase [Acidobacteria bacterium]|nr:MAG: S41 family peptidase [Acidobacteriota bacterium]REK01821.1 MAG: S41 family peptidase [Acidobacteriota bacterium]REK14777.1 MAG: S41 family peptidase [Acidobacteriota bacterium]REK45492.1 MAG: S41 family peptidase [Acidobacteriota bacterium]
MKFYRKFWLLGIGLVLVGALIGGIFGTFSGAANANANLTAEDLVSDYGDALDVVDANYIDEIDREETLDSSIQSMLWSLDPHSAFFTKDELRKLYEEQASEFYGIGVSILQYRDGVYVQSVIPGTPADKAGLRFGDRIVEVEGKDATEWSSYEVSQNVRGIRGTPVKIKVERAGVKESVPFEIVRDGVPFPSIRNYFMLKDNVGYVALSGGFQETTDAELDQAISDLRKKGMESLLLDLRGNPGGLLPQAIAVTSNFIPSGQTVVSVKGRARGYDSRDLESEGGKMDDFPLIVLINGGSASASEIVAGAVQDYGRGLVVGSESFGKGLVQKIYPLPYGTGMTLTTARYYTPYGRSLQRDYSSGSIYDYFTHSDGEEANGESNGAIDAKPKPKGTAVKTAGDRVFYGGRGIEPDIEVESLEYTPVRARINQAAFFFVRQLAAGQISGFGSYKTGKQTFQNVVPEGGLVINDALYDAFVSYAIADKENALSRQNFESEPGYSRAKLREQLATARYSSEAGQQVFIEQDPQVMKAVESIPEARKLVETIMVRR